VVADEISLRLSREQAIVFFDWLSRNNDRGSHAVMVDQAEQRVLWDLESMLEEALAAVLSSDYADIVSSARSKVRDIDE